MNTYIEKPIRNSDNNKFSFRRLGLMGSLNILLIAGLMTGSFIDQYRVEQTITNKNYPGAMAAENTQIEVPEQKPIPSLSTAFDDLPQSHLDGSNQGLKESDLKVGEYGEVENYDATIAVIGSSTAEHWLGAVLEASKNHNYRVLNITRSATRFSTGYKEQGKKVIWNNHVLGYLKDEDVDIIIGQATASDNSKDIVHQQMIDQLQYVHVEYGIQVIAIHDNPRYNFKVIESLELNGLVII